jgi:hypothetical protein
MALTSGSFDVPGRRSPAEGHLLITHPTEYRRGRMAQLAIIATLSGGLVLLASIPGYPDASEVELSKGVWPSISTVVHSVTIALESGASPMASGLFPANDPAAWPAMQALAAPKLLTSFSGSERHLSIPAISPSGCHR